MLEPSLATGGFDRDHIGHAADAAEAHRSGKRSYGYKTIAEVFGEKVAAKAAEWLGYRSGSDGATYANGEAGNDDFDDLVEATKADPAAPLVPEEIKRLVSLQKADLIAEFARVRSKLKDAGCLLAMLDKAIAKAARTGGEGVSNDIVSDVEPWPQPIDGMALLGEIEATIKRFLICGVFTPVTLSLWIAATWLADAFHVAPILNIVSPELRCGKTTCLDIVSRLVRRSMATSNISPTRRSSAFAMQRRSSSKR